jgi:hypothetical protein
MSSTCSYRRASSASSPLFHATFQQPSEREFLGARRLIPWIAIDHRAPLDRVDEEVLELAGGPYVVAAPALLRSFQLVECSRELVVPVVLVEVYVLAIGDRQRNGYIFVEPHRNQPGSVAWLQPSRIDDDVEFLLHIALLVDPLGRQAHDRSGGVVDRPAYLVLPTLTGDELLLVEPDFVAVFPETAHEIGHGRLVPA